MPRTEFVVHVNDRMCFALDDSSGPYCIMRVLSISATRVSFWMSLLRGEFTLSLGQSMRPIKLGEANLVIELQYINEEEESAMFVATTTASVQVKLLARKDRLR